jgi:type I restriction enzyme S subunit
MSGLPSSWQRTQIGSICDVVRGSSPRPIADQRYFDGGTIPWIKIADATKSGRYLYDTREKVNEFGASFSRLLPKGSLIVAASGTLGYTQMLGVPGCIHDGWLHLSGFRGVDKLFLYYWLKCQVQHFTNSAYGAAIQNINTAIMRESVIALPPLDDQRRIASILSTYDDLIENNTRRISILEEMARRIYEEWFVCFRFPGHEDVRMVESTLGLVPEGWRAAALGDVAAYINRGLAPRYDDAAASIVINQKCIRDQRLNLGEARKQCKPVPAEKVVRLGDVLINSTGVGTLGRVAQVLEVIDNCTVDTHVSIVRPGKDCDPDFFGLTVLAQQAHFEVQGVGSTGQTELSRGRIAETSVVVPPLAVQRAFGKLVQPMRRLTVTLQNKNLNLRTTRDLLLPKLISGELDVSAMPEPEALAA